MTGHALDSLSCPSRFVLHLRFRSWKRSPFGQPFRGLAQSDHERTVILRDLRNPTSGTKKLLPWSLSYSNVENTWITFRRISVAVTIYLLWQETGMRVRKNIERCEQQIFCIFSAIQVSDVFKILLQEEVSLLIITLTWTLTSKWWNPIGSTIYEHMHTDQPSGTSCTPVLKKLTEIPHLSPPTLFDAFPVVLEYSCTGILRQVTTRIWRPSCTTMCKSVSS